MKLDTHVHTWHSRNTTIPPLRNVVRESYDAPERVYAIARQRGMDLVTITNDDRISGALTLASRPDVVVGCEVTGVFPRSGVRFTWNVFGLEARHEEIQRLRTDVRELLPYIHRHALLHVADQHRQRHQRSSHRGAHGRDPAMRVDELEVTETARGCHGRTRAEAAECLAEAAGKARLGGSDCHTERGIGATWTEVPRRRRGDGVLRRIARRPGPRGRASRAAAGRCRPTSCASPRTAR